MTRKPILNSYWSLFQLFLLVVAGFLIVMTIKNNRDIVKAEVDIEQLEHEKKEKTKGNTQNPIILFGFSL